MTTRARGPAPDSAAFRFLIEDFTDVADGSPPDGIARLQNEWREVFFGDEGAHPNLDGAAFQQLRILARNLLRNMAQHAHHPALANQPLVAGPLNFAFFPGSNRPPQPIGDIRVVFWYLMTSLVSRVGLSQIGVCSAPQSKRQSEQSEGGACARLFVRRGSVRQFCSETCRARVATQRARGIKFSPPAPPFKGILDKIARREARRRKRMAKRKGGHK